MRVWLLNPFSDLSGEGAAEGRYGTLARMLAESGHDVTWWTASFHHRLKKQRKPVPSGLPYEVVQLPVPAYGSNISRARLRSHAAYGRAFACESARRAPPDVLHLSSPPLDGIQPALELKARCGCRVTLDLMDLWPETFLRVIPGPPWWKAAMGRILLFRSYKLAAKGIRMADGVSAVSEEYLQKVRRIAPEKPIHLCYVGSFRMKAHERVIQDPVEATGPIRFLYVGALSFSYDLFTVLAAARSLKEKGHAFTIELAGSGPLEQRLRQMTEEMQLNSHVRFLGYLDQHGLQDALDHADVGLNTIRRGVYITMPHKLSDYLRAGLAVINSLPGEAQDLINSANAGTTYTAGEVEQLVESMLNYLLKPELLRQHRQGARKLGESAFDRGVTYPEFIRWILAERN